MDSIITIDVLTYRCETPAGRMVVTLDGALITVKVTGVRPYGLRLDAEGWRHMRESLAVDGWVREF